MNHAIYTSFDQFCIALTEYVSRRRILANYCEVLSLYCASYTVVEVGEYLYEKNKAH